VNEKLFAKGDIALLFPDYCQAEVKDMELKSLLDFGFIHSPPPAFIYGHNYGLNYGQRAGPALRALLHDECSAVCFARLDLTARDEFICFGVPNPIGAAKLLDRPRYNGVHQNGLFRCQLL
jgi:hypothetical protein